MSVSNLYNLILHLKHPTCPHQHSCLIAVAKVSSHCQRYFHNSLPELHQTIHVWDVWKDLAKSVRNYEESKTQYCKILCKRGKFWPSFVSGNFWSSEQGKLMCSQVAEGQ